MSPPDAGAPARTVLLVDSNSITRNMLRRALATEDYVILEATDGATALRTLVESKVDLVVQNDRLADMEGPELLHRLRDLPGGDDVPVLALIGLGGVGSNGEQWAGFSDYLFKPVDSAELRKVVAANLAPRRSAAPGSGKGRRVLIVDDDPVQLKLSALRLTEAGYSVSTASDATQGLERARSLAPDAIVSDVLMPGQDGFRFCLTVRADPQLAKVPVVLASSVFADQEDRELALEVGANTLTTRTPDHRQILEALEASLGAPPPPVMRSNSSTARERYADRAIHQLERQVGLSAKLFERLASREFQMGLIYATVDALVRNESSAQLLNDLLRSCGEAIGASRGALYLLDAEDRLELGAHFGCGTADPASLKTFFGNPDVLRRAVEEAGPTPIPGRGVDPGIARAILEAGGPESLLIMPIRRGTRPLGGLWLEFDKWGTDPTSTWVVETVATQLGQSIALNEAFSRATHAENMYRDIFENAIEGIFRLSPAGKILASNPALAHILGYATPGELEEAVPNLEVVVADTARGGEFVHTLCTEKVSGLEIQARHKDGTVIWLAASGQPIRDERGSIRYSECTVQDITQRKKAEQLAVLEQARRKQLEMKDQFLSHVSHELRSPLAAAHQFVTLMLDGLAGALSPPQREYLTISLRNLNQLAAMIRDLIEITRAQTGKLSILPRRVLIGTIVEEAMDSLRPAANAKRIEISAMIDDGLPAVLADPQRVRQTVVNLAENAIKFTSSGGTVKLQVVMSSASPGFVSVTVADDGPGIGPAEHEQVFDQLYQAPDTSGDARKGLGLGLYLCKQWITRQGGRIWVDSQLGSGSRFTFTLPVFSITSAVVSLCTSANLHTKSLFLVQIRISPTVDRDLSEHDAPVLDELWTSLDRCLLPDLDVALPRMGGTPRGETFFALCFADRHGAEVLTRRIESHLTKRSDRGASLELSVAAAPIEIPPSQDPWTPELVVSHVSRAVDDYFDVPHMRRVA